MDQKQVTIGDQLDVHICRSTSSSELIIDMRYTGVYTWGESSVRGTTVSATQGGELNTGTSQHAGVFQMVLSPSYEKVRGESMDDVIARLETAKLRHTTVAGFMEFARATYPRVDEDTFFLWEASLTDLFDQADDPVIIQLDGPCFLYPNYKMMIQELRTVSSIAQEHGVTFRWI